jgi:hypothetical protein
MKKMVFSVFAALSVAVLLGGSALAQGDKSVYFVTYYSNAQVAGAPDETIRLINDGDTANTLWASFYVFDDSQELQDCCSCPITADGLLSESVNSQLASFALVLTPKRDYRGVIKVVASTVNAGGPNFTNTTAAGLHGWSTHTQSVNNRTPYGAAPFSITETPLSDANLTSSEKSLLENLCMYDHELGSGFGICRCTTEGLDF